MKKETSVHLPAGEAGGAKHRQQQLCVQCSCFSVHYLKAAWSLLSCHHPHLHLQPVVPTPLLAQRVVHWVSFLAGLSGEAAQSQR